MYAATTSSSVVSALFFGIPVHPGEDASAKEEDDWWRVFDGVLAGTDSAHYVAGQVPPSALANQEIDITGYAEVTVPDVSDGKYFQALEHNRKVRVAVAENARRKQAREDAELKAAVALAAALDTALRPKSTALLFRLHRRRIATRRRRRCWGLIYLMDTHLSAHCAPLAPLARPRPLRSARTSGTRSSIG